MVMCCSRSGREREVWGASWKPTCLSIRPQLVTVENEIKRFRFEPRARNKRIWLRARRLPSGVLSGPSTLPKYQLPEPSERRRAADCGEPKPNPSRADHILNRFSTRREEKKQKKNMRGRARRRETFHRFTPRLFYYFWRYRSVPKI